MDKDEIKEAQEEFSCCVSAERDNREAALDDIKFARLGEQWRQEDLDSRRKEGRPCLTINKLPTFIRQVVNDGRRNKPAIKVHPVDSNADVQTADIINGIIRNIEYTSGADVAYDTGLEYAVSCGIGYWRVGIEYAHDDSFDKDLQIQRIGNPFSVYGDYRSTAADSSDWNIAFVVDTIEKETFKAQYKGAKILDFSADEYVNMDGNWKDGEKIVIAERWARKEIQSKILKLSNNQIVDVKWFMSPAEGMNGATIKDLYASQGISVVGERDSTSYEVTQSIMTGAEVLSKTVWAGKYIPIVPVYGEEINIEGKRHFRSMIRDAKDAQRMFNYWRTASTEVVALAPKTPFIGRTGSFDTDIDKWETANVKSHAFIEFDGMEAPQRQPFAGVPAGALQEALNASDDIKAIMGMFDASIGARSNETSGVAINARRAEGDTSTFHFIDNQARAIAHTGRILIDLIPKVYNTERMVRIMGEDKRPSLVKVNQQGQQGQQDASNGTSAAGVYDLSAGKYDLTVSTGPGFQTQRQEVAAQITEFIRVFPQSAPFIGDILAKSQDWPEADEVAKRLHAMLPPQLQQEGNPQIQQLQQQLQQAQQQLQQQGQQMQQMQTDKQLEMEKIKIDQFNAETNRMKAAPVQQHVDNSQQMQMDDLTDSEKMQRDADLKIQLKQMDIEAAIELEMIKQRAGLVKANQDGLANYDENFEPQESKALTAIDALISQTADLRNVMLAPRKRTLIRGNDGRATHAIDEIIMDTGDGNGQQI